MRLRGRIMHQLVAPRTTHPAAPGKVGQDENPTALGFRVRSKFPRQCKVLQARIANAPQHRFGVHHTQRIAVAVQQSVQRGGVQDEICLVVDVGVVVDGLAKLLQLRPLRVIQAQRCPQCARRICQVVAECTCHRPAPVGPRPAG